MTIDIVRVGNSRGIRIPKAFLDECGFVGKVELEARKGVLIVRPARKASEPRKGWAEAYKKMAALGEDRLLDGEQPLNEWDKKEWEWK
jgi:antitoxin MazE